MIYTRGMIGRRSFRRRPDAEEAAARRTAKQPDELWTVVNATDYGEALTNLPHELGMLAADADRLKTVQRLRQAPRSHVGSIVHRLRSVIRTLLRS